MSSFATALPASAGFTPLCRENRATCRTLHVGFAAFAMRLRHPLGWVLLFLLLNGHCFAASPKETSGRGALTPAPAASPLTMRVPTDTALHFLAGSAVALVAGALLSNRYQASTMEAYPALVPAVGFSMAMFAGMTKETVDSLGFGDPEWRDLRNTVIGGTVAALILAGAQAHFGESRSGRQELIMSSLLTAAFLSIPVGVGLAEEISGYLRRR